MRKFWLYSTLIIFAISMLLPFVVMFVISLSGDEAFFTNYKNINLNVIIDGGTPLIYACYKRSYRIVKAMLDYGVDVNFIDSAGNYALVCACESKNLKICKILVEHGATLFSDYQNEELEKAIKKRDVYRLPSVYINDIYNKRRKSNY